jgi:hypothetical protein
LVESLGLTVNWDKVAGPSQTLTFLGVEVDCVRRTLALPPKKLDEVKLLIKSWLPKKKATKKEIQKLVGKLNWCCRVIQGGRTFMRNLINLISKVKLAHHYVRLGAAARSDIHWWDTGLELFHGYSPFPDDIPTPSSVFSTDACLVGGGGQYLNDWFYVDWVEDCVICDQNNINVLELKCVLLAVTRWGNLWGGKHIMVRSDNMSTVASINKTTSRSAEMLSIIKELFWLSVKYNFLLSASYIPGKLNVISDRISRLSDINCAYDACELLRVSNGLVPCKGHMSQNAFLSLQRVWSQHCYH